MATTEPPNSMPRQQYLRPPSPSSPSSTTSSANTNSSSTTLPSSINTNASTAHISAIKYAHQAAKLSHLPQDSDGNNDTAAAVRAEFITPQDPIIVTADGGRLPAVPPQEAHKLNQLKAELEGDFEDVLVERTVDGEAIPPQRSENGSRSPRRQGGRGLQNERPPYRTNPLFPPMPLYGPPSMLRDVQCMVFRCTSSVLSFLFLMVIVLGSLFTSIPIQLQRLWKRLNFEDPDEGRPYYEEEKRRKKLREELDEKWLEEQQAKGAAVMDEKRKEPRMRFEPTEGGPDPIICDVAYYARRVGLDVEKFKVETEDGFLIDLWHVYDPNSYTPLPASKRGPLGPDLFTSPPRPPQPGQKRKFPILLQHGLLQSAGAYCVNDDDSLAFYLAKAGYDVWLGNNRCGFEPQHTLLHANDPRMWAWNIRAMGVLDLAALISRVLHETGFPKLGLVAHSQGTTQTFVALAKEQRPELGEKISVFCALAPAAYAGPLIGKMYFKIMRVISPYMFRVWFGIHSFIPFMMVMHSALPGRMYGKMGYKVFSFLFNWSDERWDRGVRDRMFQFSPVYVSAESMRWWLGRECFARQKCILQTREEWRLEDKEDKLEGYYKKVKSDDMHHKLPEEITREVPTTPGGRIKKRFRKGSTAWYDERCPPIALWVAGSDDLVDGRRLLRRFNNGREPHVRIVHEKIIEEYEHLDVIWAMDSIEKVGREVKEVLWKTCGEREQCATPDGCEDVEVWEEIRMEAEGESQSESGDESEEEEMKWPEPKRKRNWAKRLLRW